MSLPTLISGRYAEIARKRETETGGFVEARGSKLRNQKRKKESNNEKEEAVR